MKKLLIFAVLFSCIGYTQQYSFVNYSLEQGLPQSQVTQITQGKNGFLWIGTLGGLARFSGKQFVNFSAENGLANNRISFVGFINDTLWVGHEKGISVQNGGKFRAIPTPQIEGGVKVVSILEYKGMKVVATNGNGLFTIQKNTLSKIFPKFNDTYNNHEDFKRIRDAVVLNHTLYVGTRMGIFYTQNLRDFTLIHGTELYSVSKLSVQNQQLYFSTFGEGVLMWNGKSIHQIIRKDSIQTTICKTLYVDQNLKVWATIKNSGVARIDKNEILWLNTQSGLPTDNISCIFEDSENNIWLGTEGKGLLKFAGEAFVYYTTKTGLSEDLIMSVYQDNQNNYWFSSFSNGITKQTYKTQTKKYLLANDSLNNHTVWCSVQVPDGSMWFGTSAGIAVFQGEQKDFYTTQDVPELPGNKISTLFKDSKGRVWIGGKNGICLYKNKQFQRITSPYNIENVRCFAEKGGQIYFVAQEGLFSIDEQQHIAFFPIIKNKPTAYSVAVDYTGRVWVGTEEGLYYLSKDKLVNFEFSKENSSNFINFITVQKQWIWIGTNNGIFKFSHIKSLNLVEVEQFGKQDGLVSLETNLNSGYIDKLGNLWFGTSGGLMKYNYLKEKPFSPILPTILFKGLKVNFEEVDLKSLYKNNPTNSANQSLDIAYSKKHLEFQFIGVGLSNPDKMHFSYKLEGFDEVWSPEVDNSTITYSNLPAGAYVLCAKVKNEIGLSSKIIRIPFTINPPFYATWWFIVLMGLLIIGLIYAVFSMRIRQFRRRQETERLLYTSRLRSLEQQSLNASMNRHFIFNALNSIQYFINTKNKLAANRYLSQFAKLIRKNLDSSTGENNNTQLADELERLELYLSIESMRFPDKFSYSFDIAKEIEPENIAVPSMIFQPFIENSIIHGILPQTEVVGKIDFIARFIDEEKIEFTINDNGIGYQNSIRQKLPSGDHQSQGMSITSSRIELLRKISGKEFKLIGPEDIFDSTGKSIGTTVKIIISLTSL